MSTGAGDPFNFGYIVQPSWPMPAPSPRTLPVNVPIPDFGSNVTIVTVDWQGNVTIKTNQVPV